MDSRSRARLSAENLAFGYGRKSGDNFILAGLVFGPSAHGLLLWTFTLRPPDRKMWMRGSSPRKRILGSVKDPQHGGFDLWEIAV